MACVVCGYERPDRCEHCGAKMTKVVAIMGGGDWTDASISLLDVPEDVDIEQAKKEYREWYAEYLRQLHQGVKKMMAIEPGSKFPKHFTFAEWLKEYKGAKNNTSVEEVWEE